LPLAYIASSAVSLTLSTEEISHFKALKFLKPAYANSSSVAFNAFSFKSQTVTFAFNFKNLLAKFFPKPIAPPVINTCLPATDFLNQQPLVLSTDYKNQ